MDFRHPGHAMNLSDSTAQAAGDRRLPVVLLVHDRVLGRRLLLHVNARYLAAATLALLALTAGRLVGVSGSGVRWLVIVACVIAVYNTVIRGLARPRSDPERATEARAFLRLVLLASILFDYVALTVTVWLLGGTDSPFLAFYLFHVVISSFLLPRPAAAVSVLLAVACLAVVVFGELWGVLPAASPEALVRREGAVGWRYSAVVFAIYSSLFALTAILVISLTHLLRVAEMENQRKTRDLEELSSMRREYLLVALHDIHSPIGLVAMLLRNMLNGVCGPLGASQTSQLERAMTHLDRLETFLQELRTLSQLDTANLADRMTEVPVVFLVNEVLDQEREHAEAKGLRLRLEPTEAVGLVWGVPTLVREAIANYVTNAIKYTPEGGAVGIVVREGPGTVRLEVRDTGIGISAEDQARLFREFVRVGRDNPLAKQAKGTGLGLSLVQRIAEAHGGRVGVESQLGRGSTFWLELPSCQAVSGPATA